MGEVCVICANKKGLSLITDEIIGKPAMNRICDALISCFNIRFLGKHCEKDVKICKKCIARLKYCYSFRKDVEIAHRNLYEQHFNEKVTEYEVKIEAQPDDIQYFDYNEEYSEELCTNDADDINDQYKGQTENVAENNREYIESYSNDDYEMNNQYENQTGYASDFDDSPYRSDWSQDTDDILLHTGYSQELEKSKIIKKYEIPFLEKGATKCPVCGRGFALHSSLVIHHPTHFPKNQCDICGRLVANSDNYKKHRALHDKKFVECKVCLRKFSNKIGMHAHYKRMHLGIDRLMCHICKKRIKHPNARVKHLVEVHQMESAKFKCIYCDFRYVTTGDFMKHLRAEHFDEHNFKCEECNLIFISNYQMREHNKKHLNIKEYKCEYCFKEFWWNKTYKQHLKTHFKT